MILAGDIGGTKTNLGLFEAAGEEIRIRRFNAYRSADFAGLAPVISQFLNEGPGARPSLRAACFGIAGPVMHNEVNTPNLAWRVDGADLAATLDLPLQQLLLLNDLVATAEGIPLLAEGELAVIQRGVPQPSGNRVLLAAGTGLGMSLLPRIGERWIPQSSEGGHADFAPRNEDEVRLLLWLERRYGGHVSVERVLSGPGLVHLYEYLRDERKVPIEATVDERLREEDPAQVITEAALAHRDPLSERALHMFVAIYGAAAGNLALLGTAEGGVFLGGGIAPKILPALSGSSFLDAFAHKGRFSDYLRRVPIQVILNDRAALLGAARRAARLTA